jgi:Ras-related protein Rab-11A
MDRSLSSDEEDSSVNYSSPTPGAKLRLSEIVEEVGSEKTPSGSEHNEGQPRDVDIMLQNERLERAKRAL